MLTVQTQKTKARRLSTAGSVPPDPDIRPNPARLVLVAGLRGSPLLSGRSTLGSHLAEHGTEPSFVRASPHPRVM